MNAQPTWKRNTSNFQLDEMCMCHNWSGDTCWKCCIEGKNGSAQESMWDYTFIFLPICLIVVEQQFTIFAVPVPMTVEKVCVTLFLLFPKISDFFCIALFQKLCWILSSPCYQILVMWFLVGKNEQLWREAKMELCWVGHRCVILLAVRLHAESKHTNAHSHSVSPVHYYRNLFSCRLPS